EGVSLNLGESAPAIACSPDGEVSEESRGLCLILKPPIHLAACRRNQRGLLPGTTPSCRRWHSSQGRVPPSETLSSARHWPWVCMPQPRHLSVLLPIVTIPGARLSSRQIG
ncbi:unnamed protein product, partial [Ectocarpus sp. 4 AP-2014]